MDLQKFRPVAWRHSPTAAAVVLAATVPVVLRALYSLVSVYSLVFSVAVAVASAFLLFIFASLEF